VLPELDEELLEDELVVVPLEVVLLVEVLDDEVVLVDEVLLDEVLLDEVLDDELVVPLEVLPLAPLLLEDELVPAGESPPAPAPPPLVLPEVVAEDVVAGPAPPRPAVVACPDPTHPAPGERSSETIASRVHSVFMEVPGKGWSAAAPLGGEGVWDRAALGAIRGRSDAGSSVLSRSPAGWKLGGQTRSVNENCCTAT